MALGCNKLYTGGTPMKLRHKKTGEIGYFTFANWDDPVLIIRDKNGVQLAKYNSLAELNEEWEDYEEKQLGYWYYDTTANRVDFIDASNVSDEDKKLDQQIGNYFETEEEAEKAVEKLKAVKRLKDKGFRFDGWSSGLGKNTIYIIFWSGNDGELDLRNDLDLLFSGGEE